MSTGKLVSVVVAGLAVGSIMGILYAPDKGSETRKKISDKHNEFMDKIKSKCSDLSNSLKQQFESLAEQAHHVAEEENNELGNVKNNDQING